MSRSFFPAQFDNPPIPRALSLTDRVAVCSGTTAFVCTVQDIITAVGGGGGGTGLSNLTQQSNDPPTDGSVSTLFFRNTVSKQKFMNTGTAQVPAWEIIG
jgi:hypothetical protein